MAERKKHPGGRPTDYRETFCDEIIGLMASGLSLTASMAELGHTRQSAYDWIEKHPEFAYAVKRAQAKRQLFLERRLLSADATSPVVTSTIFALKNAAPEDWRDRIVNEHTGKDGGPLAIEIVRFAEDQTS